jgi:hypothetical protein
MTAMVVDVSGVEKKEEKTEKILLENVNNE